MVSHGSTWGSGLDGALKWSVPSAAQHSRTICSQTFRSLRELFVASGPEKRTVHARSRHPLQCRAKMILCIQTLRFVLGLNRAAVLVRPNGAMRLRLMNNNETRRTYQRIATALALNRLSFCHIRVKYTV